MINKVLLIDANNLAFRVHWTNKRLTHNGMSVSLLYGFIRSLVSFRRRFSDYFPIVVWDSSSSRRKKEASVAVENKIIPSGYKSNRINKDNEDLDPMLESLFQQMVPLKEGLKLCRVLQVYVDGYEADDVIYSYSKNNSLNGIETLIVTSDKDYYQILKYPNVVLYDAMKSVYWTKEVFIDSYGLDPSFWVDVGALSGDKSDNIFGIPGIGEVTALGLVKEHGNIDGIITALNSKEKRKKKEQNVLDYKDRLYLAKSLKQMDYVENLPNYKCSPKNIEPLIEWLKSFNFVSIEPEAWRLV